MVSMGMHTVDLAGQDFGRLTVKTRIPREPGTQGQALWLCLCNPALGGCGTLKPVGSGSLRHGLTQSCGCLHRERTAASNTIRGNAGGLAARANRPRAYSSWRNMIRRCTRESDPRYKDWGGRGITIDPRWMTFANFLADMGERPPGMSLERKNGNGPYAAWNCVWATPHQQQVNTRAFKLVPEVVAEIKRLRTTGLSMRAIGTRTGLDHQTVSRALSGKGRSRNPDAVNGIVISQAVTGGRLPLGPGVRPG
jgi:hypothetical protein